MARVPNITFIELGLSYEVYPPNTDSTILSPSPAGIELTTDFNIPESVWEKYKDDKEQLLRWTIQHIVIPGLTDYLSKPDVESDEDE